METRWYALAHILKTEKAGKCIATGLDDGSVSVWDVQDGRKIRQVTLNSLPHGSISCLSWMAEDSSARKRDADLVSLKISKFD